jgi:hypothetical protein
MEVLLLERFPFFCVCVIGYFQEMDNQAKWFMDSDYGGIR